MHIAQVNLALPRAPIDSRELATFVALLEPVNALADGSPGFVWRLQTDAGDATGVRGFGDDRLIINMSVWESVDALAQFVYRSDHVAVMRRRREWFERMRLFMVLWWVPAGHVPTVAETETRLEYLREHGPSAFAFTFKQRFPPPAGPAAPAGTGALEAAELGCPA